VKYDLGQAARAKGGPGLVPGWRWAEIAREQAAEQHFTAKVAEKAGLAVKEGAAKAAAKVKHAAEIVAEQVAKEQADANKAAAVKAAANEKANTLTKAKKVLEKINVQQVVVEETAPKKAKVSKFDSVDMELEALAYRIDSMGSGCEDTSWRRSGWRR
jgi:colicin import membrane protein